MQTPLNTFDKQEPLDYDNLNIIIYPQPPRRRPSGASLVPFRPYVKCLTGIRQPLSSTDGYDKWMVIDKEEILFRQPNARCIGTLIDDCDISDVIRWDIEGESTRLPMMCKLWMIVDGAVIERGKPHLVQDIAIQIFTSGRSYRAITAEEQRYNQTSTTTAYDRHRRHSWHDINEYHSVSYYQYTRVARIGSHKGIQCDMDNEYFVSRQEILTEVEEETTDHYQINDFRTEKVQETVNHSSIPKNHIHISMITQAESQLINQSTSIDNEFIQMLKLNLETKELLLSSLVNPHRRIMSVNNFSETIPIYHNNIEYKHQSISTGDNYPPRWCQLTTEMILSNFVRSQDEEKKFLPLPSPPQNNQSIQTNIQEPRTLSASRLSRVDKRLLSTVTPNHYEIISDIDNENNTKSSLLFHDDYQRIDRSNLYLNDYRMENLSTYDYAHTNKELISPKQSENDCYAVVSPLNRYQKHPYSTADHLNSQESYRCYSNDISNRKSSETVPTKLLANLLERYERTLHERQRAIAMINDELFDIDNVLEYYRGKIRNSSSIQSNRAMNSHRDISLLSAQSKQDQSSSIIINQTKDKYRSMPRITSEEMIQGYTPLPKAHITKSLITSTRQRQPRFEASSKVLTRPNYCDLCFTDHNAGSSWIRYNEQRIEELQKRIDLMLQIDDSEEIDLLISSPIKPTIATVTQRIDDILMRRSRYHKSYLDDYCRTQVLSRRYSYRLPYRLNQSLPNSLRLLTRSVTHSRAPVLKSVRMSTQSVPPHTNRRLTYVSRPPTSMLHRYNASSMPQSTDSVQSSHIWKNKVNEKMYFLEQYNIPRYYRLYDDVSFRDIYNFSRILNAYLDSNRTSTKLYSSMIKNFALEHRLPLPITSTA